jgi:AcrR family transcriptional regulator
MPRSDAQFHDIRTRSRDNILDAAERLFARHGYAGTSVRMLAAEAGVSQGLLYNYFDGKQALLRAIFERSMEEVRADLDEADAGASSGESLARLVRGAFETLRANPDFWRITYQIRMQPDVIAELGDTVGAWTSQIVGRIEGQLRRAGVRDAAARARLLFAAIDGAAQHWVLDPDGYPLDDVAAAAIALLTPATERSAT